MKKAREISLPCDDIDKVSLVIFASSGKMHEYCIPSTKVIDVLDRYQTQTGTKLWDPKHEEDLNHAIDRIKKENDTMQMELRSLKDADITSLNHNDLMAIEAVLEKGLVSIRNKQDELLRRLRIKGIEPEEQNKSFCSATTSGEASEEE